MSDHYSLLSWVRDGAAAQITREEDLSDDSPQRAWLNVVLDVQGKPSGQIDEVAVELALYGPGDVQSLDRDEIVRVDPPPGSEGFEPNYVPVIEFRRADLPWMLTPVAGGSRKARKLRPWLALVVVRKHLVSLEPGSGGRLPRLRTPLSELPDPADNWAWAHAQVTNLEAGERLTDVLQTQPERALSRLIGARRLVPDERYYACVVPTFKAGAQARLGEPVTVSNLAPAWPSPTNADTSQTVDLLVYYHWGFGTGQAGDFEQLVRRLQPHTLGAAAAVRSLDVGEPGGGVVVHEPGAPPEVLALAGALAPQGHIDQAWDTPAGQRFADELRAKFDAMIESRTKQVGPPLYGRWYAGPHLARGLASVRWLRELNLDPRLRVCAGLGALTVQKFQEDLMASAWDQLDQIEAVNQYLRQAQLAVGVSSAVRQRRYGRMRSGTLLQVTSPAHAQLQYGGISVRNAMQGSAAPGDLVATAMRARVQPRGPLYRRAARYRTFDTDAVVQDACSGEIKIYTDAGGGTGVVFLQDLGKTGQSQLEPADDKITAAGFSLQNQKYRSGGSARFTAWTKAAPRTGPPKASTLNLILNTGPRVDNAFIGAIGLMQMQQRLTTPPAGIDASFPDVADMAVQIRADLEPALTVQAYAESVVDSSVLATGDALEPIMAAPSFPQPMVEALQEAAPGFADWHTVDGAGLRGIDSHPEAVEREIVDFLARHRASWYRDPEPTGFFEVPAFAYRHRGTGHG